MVKAAVVCFFVFLIVSPSLQWGEEGHKVIAKIASDMLSDTAYSAVQNFLDDNSMAYVAPIPDTYDHTTVGAWSAPCHYVNMPSYATQYEPSYCGSCCVVGAINNYTSILDSEANDPIQCYVGSNENIEPCALIFLIHFVGDSHQPLHVGYANDSGGNQVKVSFFGKSANLHQCWDTLMIEKYNNDYYDFAEELEGVIQDNPDLITKYTASMDPTDWADESFHYVETTCYNYTVENGVPQIDEQYYDYNMPIIQERLIAAGIRLGTLLNSILG